MKNKFDSQILFFSALFVFIAIGFQIWLSYQIQLHSNFLDNVSSPKLIIRDYQFIDGDSHKTSDGQSFEVIRNPNSPQWQKGEATFLPNNELGYAWLRTKVYPENITNDSVFIFEHTNVVFEIYQDDSKISSYGDVNNLNSIRFKGSTIEILPLLPKKSEYIYARIRYNDKYNFNLGGRFISIGSKFSILKLILIQEIIPLSFSLLTFAIGVFSVFIYILRWNGNYTILFNYGIFMISSGCALFSNCILPQIYINFPEFSIFLNTISVSFTSIFMIKIFLSVFQFQYWNYLKFLYYSYIFMFITLMLLLSTSIYTGKLISYMIIPSITLLVLYAIGNITLGTISILKWKNKDYTSVFLGVVFYLNIGLLLFDIFKGIIFEDSLIWYNHWSIFFSILAQSLILDKEFKNHSNQLISFESNLLKVKSELESLQLESIRDKMNPEYLFSSLRLIRELIIDKDPKINDAILCLSENYRYLLDKSSLELVYFDEEWNFTKDYIYLTKLKYLSSLEIYSKISSQLKKHKVTPLSIQPIIEMIIDYFSQKESSYLVVLNIEIKPIENKIVIHIEINMKKQSIINHKTDSITNQSEQKTTSTEKKMEKILNSIQKRDINYKVSTQEDSKSNITIIQFRISSIKDSTFRQI